MINTNFHMSFELYLENVEKIKIFLLSKEIRKRQVLVTNVISFEFPRNERGETWVNITFFDSDAIGTNPRDNNLVVITVQHDNWDIKRVLINPRSSADCSWTRFRNFNSILARSKC